MKIVGIVFAKNEWGLIAVSISHALINHVDEVYVVDHNSTDQTHNGLKHLKQLWGERLHIITITSIGFFQEEATNTIIGLAKKSNPDWVYVFDADEFLLVDQSTSLRAILSATDMRYKAIRYPLNNYISLSDFNDLSLDDYKKIIHKSTPNPEFQETTGAIDRKSDKKHQNVKTSAELIYDGEATFFDIPFPPKVIIRFSNFMHLESGAHSAIDFKGEMSGILINEIEAVHLTYPTKKRLKNKAKQGEFHIKNNFPPNHGWQNQLVYKIKEEGRLDWFWAKHSISENSTSENLSPAHIIDRRFSEIISRTIDFLEKGFQSKDLSMVSDTLLESGSGNETMIPISEMISLAKGLQNQKKALAEHFYNTLQEKRLYRLLKTKKHIRRQIRKKTRF